MSTEDLERLVAFTCIRLRISSSRYCSRIPVSPGTVTGGSDVVG